MSINLEVKSKPLERLSTAHGIRIVSENCSKVCSLRLCIYLIYSFRMVYEQTVVYDNKIVNLHSQTQA